jgi:hypothetical protein
MPILQATLPAECQKLDDSSDFAWNLPEVFKAPVVTLSSGENASEGVALVRERSVTCNSDRRFSMVQEKAENPPAGLLADTKNV